MGLLRHARLLLGVILLIVCFPAGAADTVVTADSDWINPWRNPDGSFRDKYYSADYAPAPGPELMADLIAADSIPAVPDANVPVRTLDAAALPIDVAQPAMLQDRGIDSADTKWRRQARIQGVRMRMLNGPEGMVHADPFNSATERGLRLYEGAVVPLNTRWELAAIHKTAAFKTKTEGWRAGLEALTLRLGANPSVSFRPWVAVTPYAGLWDGDGYGVGLSAGLSKNWSSGIGLEGEAYAWQPWDEGYETARYDGRSHGMRLRGTLPVDRRLSFIAEAEYEWFELGPHAPGGSKYAGRRGSWTLRADWKILKRDSAYMGYGFREETLWSEQLVPVELGVFADIHQQRYIRPQDFEELNPTRKSLRQRMGLFYYQALSPHIGFNTEAYVGQDPLRDISAGQLYGVSLRLNVVASPRLKFWFGWGYESNTDTLGGGGGPDRTFNFGLHYNF